MDVFQSGKENTLRLPQAVVGRMLNSLSVCAEEWEATYEHPATGLIRNDFIVRECSDEREAAAIAGYYREIIAAIALQLPDVSVGD